MSSNQEFNREAVVILDDDVDTLGMFRHPKFAEMLKTEGVNSELILLENVDALKQTIAQRVKVVCLVTDLGGLGWGSVDGILRFNAEQDMQTPVLITTGSDLTSVTGGFATEADLNEMGISLLQKPYTPGKLVARIKLLINAARSL